MTRGRDEKRAEGGEKEDETERLVTKVRLILGLRDTIEDESKGHRGERERERERER